jgi:hypothetical protein
VHKGTLHFTISGVIDFEDMTSSDQEDDEIKLQIERYLTTQPYSSYGNSGIASVRNIELTTPKTEDILVEQRKIIILFADKLKEYGLSFEMNIDTPSIVSIHNYKERRDMDMVTVDFCCYHNAYELRMSCYKSNRDQILFRGNTALDFDYDKFVKKIKNNLQNIFLIKCK